MTDGRASRASGAWWPYLSSFALHGVLVALIAVGWFQFRTPLPPQPLQLAIEATVVDGLPPPPATVPPPPASDPAELQAEAGQKAAEERKAAEVRRAAEAQEAEQRRVEAEAADAERRRKLEADRKVEAQKKAEAQRKAEAQKKAEAEKKADAEKKAQLARQLAEEEKRKAAELQKQAEQAALEREQAELRARMAAEERVTAARSGAQAAQYKALIRARIERAWIRPPSARAGLDCEVRVTQVPGGAVTAVKIDRCNGDAAVRESIEAAVYRASPLPVPENPDLFERNLVFNFRPND